ncbi:MAG: hypothetical protein E6Q75_05310 [Rheinheimera sp.]|nr:MAG: hypothetical protein E6Q75_05310 [Rheinheimera sp.]
MTKDSVWQIRRPKRWFNALLFYTGWLVLVVHLVLMLYCYARGLTYPMSWWFVALSPVLSVLWGGVPALQLQKEAGPAPTVQARFRC